MSTARRGLRRARRLQIIDKDGAMKKEDNIGGRFLLGRRTVDVRRIIQMEKGERV